LSFIAPNPSILQSMLWSPSTRRMFLTRVPTFNADDAPLTAIAVLQHGAVGVLDDEPLIAALAFCRLRPFMAAFGTDQQRAVFVDVGGLALGTGGQRYVFEECVGRVRFQATR